MQPNFVRIVKGFTILELMIVVAIAGILLALAVPSYQKSAVKAREAALKQNLFTIRNVIDQFYADRGVYPPSLPELVEAGYLRSVPVDPFTKSADTWQEIFQDQTGDDDQEAGVFDIHSGSELSALDGTLYNEW